MATRSWIRKLFGHQARPRPARLGPRRRASLALEGLEDRLAPATLTVTSPADTTTADDVLTLREAVLLANAAGDATAALGHALTAAEAAQVSGSFGPQD